MFLRLWFHLCKLAILGFLLFGASFFLGGDLGRVLGIAGMAIGIPIGALGALLGIRSIFGMQSACPFCGTTGPWLFYPDYRIVLVCEDCGAVCGNPFTNMSPEIVNLDDYEDADDDDDEDDED